MVEKTNLPALVGSEKQIAWAEAIREDYAKVMTEDAKLVVFVGTPEFQTKAAKAWQVLEDKITNEIRADWWISKMRSNRPQKAEDLRTFFKTRQAVKSRIVVKNNR